MVLVEMVESAFSDIWVESEESDCGDIVLGVSEGEDVAGDIGEVLMGDRIPDIVMMCIEL